MIADAIAEKVPPTHQTSIDAELKATKYHLEDMRTLVLKTRSHNPPLPLPNEM
jgi:hypothetical protein